MRICRNTENDRVFPFDDRLARETWIEILDVEDMDPLPEVMSEGEKFRMSLRKVDKSTLPKDDYERMHYTKIKKMVEQRGGRWIDKKNGIQWLRELDAKAEKAS